MNCWVGERSARSQRSYGMEQSVIRDKNIINVPQRRLRKKTENILRRPERIWGLFIFDSQKSNFKPVDAHCSHMVQL